MNTECPHLLIVEDEEAHVEAIRRAYDAAGGRAEICVAGTLREYREQIAAHPPDLVLLDLNLPDGRAVEVLTHPPEDAPFPILVMTAFGNQQIVVDLMKAGALDYVVKSPEVFAAMPQVVERALREWKLRKERQQSELAQRVTEQRYRNLFEQSRDGIVVMDRGGRVVDANRRYAEMLGYSPEEVLRLHVWDWDTQWTRKQLLDMLQSIDSIGTFIETGFRRKDGSIYDVEIDSNAVHIGEQELVFCICRDITERKKAEQKLKDVKTLTDAIVENIPLMIFLKEATDLRFVVFNRAGEELLGYDRNVLLGKNNLDLFPPEQAANFMAKDREVLDGEAGMLDIPEESIQTAKKGERLLHTRKVCIRGSDGKTIYLLGVSEDITERKQDEAEKEKLQWQLIQAQKMEAIGRLAGGVAHDFNNMLMVIMGNAELCKMKIDAKNPLHRWLGEISKGAIHARTLTRQLLAFSRRQVVAPEILNINATIADMLKILPRLIGEDIAIVWRPGAVLGLVNMDPSQIDQILTNLAVNARDAIQGTGTITIATTNATRDQSEYGQHSDATPGDYVLLTFSDTGCGMDPETRAHVFEPFFTTKEVGKGTGLGLATVYGIVKQNNGYIEVSSEPGKGTQFKIYLPYALDQGVYPVTEETPAEAAVGGSETILLAEDEESVRAIACEFLASLGYTVLVAEGPEKALRLATEHPGEIQLLLTDVIMPGMNGRDLSLRLREIRPAIKSLFISGFTADVLSQRGILADGVNFLAKPFSRDKLACKVREVLDA